MIWIRHCNLTSTLNFPPRFTVPVGVMMVAVLMVFEMVYLYNIDEAIVGSNLVVNFLLNDRVFISGRLKLF